jgi:hypothetical protein
MPKLTLHFEAGEGTDLEAAAAALQANLAGTDGVESARTRPQKFQAIGPAEIMSIIQIATTVVQTTSTFLVALAALHTAWEKVTPMFPGLHAPEVEVGLKKVPLDKLTPEHVAELASDD